MDLRKYKPTDEQVARLKGLIGYQPFILSDNVQTGVGDKWANKTDLKVAEKDKVSPAAWKQFTEANGRMRKMYDDWIEQMCDLVGAVSEMTVVDTAANAGFFPYRFLERGAHRAIAYDMNSKLAQIYDLLNSITGFEAEFVNTPYDQMTHEIPGAEKGDIVISSAIMCHLSDPLYYLNFLSSITKKALFLFTSIDDSKQLRITYREPGKFYPEYPFPICFDNMTTVSRPLIELGLRELGFKEIVELEYRKDWLPMSWYKQFKAIVALR